MQKQTAAILSAHLSGFLRIAETCSADEIAGMMDELNMIIENVVRLHHGKISQFSGEKLMAVFEVTGAKLAHPVDAAIELKEQLNAFAKSKAFEGELGLKSGLAFGEIITAEFGSRDARQSTIMGEAVNHANRIGDFADADQILVDENIYKSTQKSFEYQSLEPIPLKDTDDTLPIFELTGKKHKKLTLKSKGERRIVSEMVGRHKESVQLEGLIKHLINGKGHIVNIIGKAGIGKSRLIAEMKVQPVIEKVQMLEGRASSTGQNLSYHPIISLIRSWASITEEDASAKASEKLQTGIEKIAPGQADEIFAFLATMMGLPLEGKHKERVQGIEGEALEKLILKNLRDLIIDATKDKPRIYLIEDMHWSDASSIAMFESLYKLSLNHPVMFINVMRPGYKETGDHILKYLVDNFPGDHTTIHVNPLEETESGKLIKNLLRETPLPVEIQTMIIRKSEGNPFFIEEILRSFLDEGIIGVKAGHFIVTEKINDVNIPETINEAILSRVDKLDEKTRELLNTASVMGRNFYYKILEEATDTIEELDERLAYLTEVQLITETKKKEDIEYLFKHALAQQLTYDAMMQQSRKDTHLKIARSIEKVFAANINEFYGTLAYHYSQAKNNEKTLQYMILAGDESAKSGASLEALNYYREAYDLLPYSRKNDRTDSEVRDLEIKIALGYHAIGKNFEAVVGIESLMSKYFGFKFPKSDRGIKIKGTLSILGLIFIINNHWLFFKKKMFEDFDIFGKIANHLGFALLHLNPKQWAYKVATIEIFVSQYDICSSMTALNVFCDGSSIYSLGGVSINTSQKILDFVQKFDIEKDPTSWVNFILMKKVHDYYIAKWELDKDFDQVYRTGLKTGGSWVTSSYVYYSGMGCIELGKYTQFLEMAEKMKELADSFDYTYTRTLRLRLLIMGYAKFGMFNKILTTVDNDIAFVRSTGNEVMLLIILLYKAQACLKVGEMDAAEAAINESKKMIANQKRVPIYITQYLITMIKFGVETIKDFQPDDNNFRSRIKELQKLSKKLITKAKKNIATLSEAYQLNARILLMQGKNGRAIKNLSHCITIGEKYHSLPDLSRAYFELGKFLSDPKTGRTKLNGLTGTDYLQKAKKLFEEMDLQWDKERYEEYMNLKNRPVESYLSEK